MTSRLKAWIARALALAAGAGAALAHPPFGILPGLLGYALLMALIDRGDAARPLRSAFLRGWLAGLGYFSIGVWWVGEAFLIDAAQAWMAPFAVVLLAGGLALFWGAAAALYRRFAPAGVRRVLVFAGAVSMLEWLRGHVLTGLPWNLPGETFRAGTAISISADARISRDNAEYALRAGLAYRTGRQRAATTQTLQASGHSVRTHH